MNMLIGVIQVLASVAAVAATVVALKALKLSTNALKYLREESRSQEIKNIREGKLTEVSSTEASHTVEKDVAVLSSSKYVRPVSRRMRKRSW